MGNAWPAPLSRGARVALVALSSPVPPERLRPAVDAVRGLGLDPVVYPGCFARARHGYFAADDATRAADLTRAMTDDTVRGVLCMRGGYGLHRILPRLDFAALGRRPKPLVGYSDVTALHTALGQACGLVTFHAPMPASEYYAPTDRYTMDFLSRALFGGLTGRLDNPPGEETTCLVGGVATGPLCGGNLSLLAASLGTPWELDTRGKILFLEDVGEKTYRIDAMLTQLRNAGKLASCAGIVLGQFVDCTAAHPDQTLTQDEIFAQLIAPAGKPTLCGLACGHATPTMSLPLGATTRLDATRRTLEVLA